MSQIRINLALTAGAAVIAGGSMLLAAACSSSGNANATPIRSQTPTTSSATTAPAIISAINLLDNAGLHDFNQSIDQGTIPPTALNTVTHLLAVLKLTPWPDALKTQAGNMTSVMQVYFQQLNANTPDMTKLRPAATNAHEGEHQFSHDVWDWIYQQAGINASAPTSDSD